MYDGNVQQKYFDLLRGMGDSHEELSPDQLEHFMYGALGPNPNQFLDTGIYISSAPRVTHNNKSYFTVVTQTEKLLILDFSADPRGNNIVPDIVPKWTSIFHIMIFD